MAGYDFSAIEKKWQEHWHANNTFRQPNPGEAGFEHKPKLYVLDMFPYPSGAGLHVGHPEGYTATDIISRFARMKGYNVLHPMGYDSFGLPAEQYAVEHGVHPRETTAKNIANIERQIKMFGFSYDWSRRVATTDVEYYRWTQWIFLQIYNSWLDPVDGKAKPIRELRQRLESGKLVVDIDGSLVWPELGNRTPLLNLNFADPGQMKWHELSPDEQAAILDAQRLAYIAEVPVNWCPKLGTVLANEEVTNEGRSERGNYPVYRRALKQWMLRITAYAERLLTDLDLVDWPEPIKIMQRNWIGKSLGAEIDFFVACPGDDTAEGEWFSDRQESGFPGVEEEGVIRVFTTRPDTLYGATYMVLAPEHPLVAAITTPEQKAAVDAYVQQALNKSDLERTADAKDKTGVFTGAYAINPAEHKPIPIWVADYVMMGYGTGAIMAVPAHDTRDFEFATKFNLPITQVVAPPADEDWRGFTGDGTAVNSGMYTGLPTAEFKTKITANFAAMGLCRQAVNYKLRDWLFSRQRYWGEPFPIIHCPTCGVVDLPESALPLELPDMDDFSPVASDDPDALPQPPLGKADAWATTACPRCGGPAKRELNTMPQWAGSCWYYLRYLDPRNSLAFVNPKIEQYWMRSERKGQQSPLGVDLYVGGAEHAVLHLLYSRFWHKVLFDLGHVSTPEPFGKLFNQGMITGFTYRDSRGIAVPNVKVDTSGDKPRHMETGETLVESIEKMSKGLKNVVNPDDVIGQYGADTFRLYEMFMGPLEASKPWNTRDVPGVHRFLQRVWRMVVGNEDHPPILADADEAELEKVLHRLIRMVGEEVLAMKFNTPIAAMMSFVNHAYKIGRIGRGQVRRFLLVLAPFAPHIAEELWQRTANEGGTKSLAHEPWPMFDEAMTHDDSIEIPVQINGKIRARIQVPATASEVQVLDAALTDPTIAAAMADKTLVKRIVIPGRLVNLVVK